MAAGSQEHPLSTATGYTAPVMLGRPRQRKSRVLKQMVRLDLARLDSWLWPAAAQLGSLGSAALTRRRRSGSKPLILRPGGMGDLILLCVAVEELGLTTEQFFWLIERRSAPWAKHVDLDFVCYDDSPLRTHLQLAGRYPLVINTEQRFGLSQATALLARHRGGKLVSFDTNVAAGRSDRVVHYDPLNAHETVEFGRLLAAALGLHADVHVPVRRRRIEPTERPVVGIGGLQSQTRNLPQETWFQLIEAWRRRRSVYLVASPADRPFASRLAARLGQTAEVFRGDFDAVCDLVMRSAEALTIDSGFLHIASYYGVPVTSIFTSSREKKWASLSPDSHLIRRRDLACQPCALFAQVPPCHHGFACKNLDFASHFL